MGERHLWEALHGKEEFEEEFYTARLRTHSSFEDQGHAAHHGEARRALSGPSGPVAFRAPPSASVSARSGVDSSGESDAGHHQGAEADVPPQRRSWGHRQFSAAGARRDRDGGR